MKAAKRPLRLIPMLYLGTAHASLALACLLVAWSPRAVAGFFYHSWMLAIVHLVTLGWITCSILGALYIVGPVALRLPLPARRTDYVAWLLVIVGIVGMVAHFWIAEFGGMAWSAATVTIGILCVATRVVSGLRRSSAQPAIKLHILLACVNITLAATMGILIAFDKVYHFLPGYVLSNVFAHAHLAAIGWGAMMVIGVGYRLLPMTIPSQMTSGPSMFVGAALLEVGVLGLFVALLRQSAWTRLFGVVIVAGLSVFLGHVVSMVRGKLSRPRGTRRIDYALLHATAAGVWLVAAALIGTMLIVSPVSPAMLRAAAAYGVLGLVGFLAQMVTAIEARLLPLFAWYWAYERSGHRTAPTLPARMRDPILQALVFSGWTVGVPALALGFAMESPAWIALGAWSLFAAVAVATIDNLFVLAGAVAANPAFSQARRLPSRPTCERSF